MKDEKGLDRYLDRDDRVQSLLTLFQRQRGGEDRQEEQTDISTGMTEYKVFLLCSTDREGGGQEEQTDISTGTTKYKVFLLCSTDREGGGGETDRRSRQSERRERKDWEERQRQRGRWKEIGRRRQIDKDR